MSARLKGGPELRRKLKAIQLTFKPVGRKWADATADVARERVPVKTGRLRQSIRRKNATQKRATVSAHYTATFVDGGTKAHDIVAIDVRFSREMDDAVDLVPVADSEKGVDVGHVHLLDRHAPLEEKWRRGLAAVSLKRPASLEVRGTPRLA